MRLRAACRKVVGGHILNSDYGTACCAVVGEGVDGLKETTEGAV